MPQSKTLVQRLFTALLIAIIASSLLKERGQASMMRLTTLSITNVVNNPTPNVGANVVFTITVSNPSPSPSGATNVTVAAKLPPGLNYVSHAITATPSILSSTYDSVSGAWTIGNLGIDASATLNVTAQVVLSIPNPNDYSVTVSSTEFSDQTAIASITLVAGTDSDLSLTHDPMTISTSVADQASLKIRLHNAGPDAASNVQVKDLLPSGLTFVSYASSIGTYSSSTGIWKINSLAVGVVSTDDAILTLTVKVSSSGTSTKNFAEVWQSDQFDTNSTPGNGPQTIPEDDESSLEVPIADLSLTQTVDISGSNAVFTLKVNNAGPDAAAGVVVKNSKLASATSYTYVSDGETAGTYSNTGINAGEWTIPTLLNGASATLTVTTTIVSLDVNWAQISSVSQVDSDSAPANCGSTLPTCTEDDDASAPSADLSLIQSVLPINPDVGTNVIFKIIITNAGIAGTTNVQVKDLLPSGLTYVSNDLGSAYVSSTGIWTVGTLAASGVGSTSTLNITAKVAANGIYTNAAEVWKSDEADPDSTPGNGSTTEDDEASATVTSYRSIVINEVAWAGTAASANDEWIELYNPSSASINITGWTLKSVASPLCSAAAGSLNISLSGAINSGGYFLLEREDNSTVSDVTADQVYTISPLSNLLSDSGERLILCDGSGNFIDTANGNGGAWPQGSSSGNYGTMERQGTSTEGDTTWVTNLGNPKNGKDANSGLIYGTPRKVNSNGTAVSATPTAKKNPTPVVTSIPLVGRLIINEFLPRPGYDWNQDGEVNVYDEFIEVKNIGTASVNLSSWQLDDEANLGSNPFTMPSISLKPGERQVFYGLQTNILLSDGGDTVRLINSSGKIYDSYTYAIAKVEDRSVCRLPDGNGSWYEDCVPTPNLTNTRKGVVPSMPGNGTAFESPVCDLPDSLPADFLFAECHGYGAEIWHSFYWDKYGWQGDQYIPGNMNKWESFVE